MRRHSDEMVIALDLEGTLISNAVSQIPRPGLWSFLEGCRSLAERVVIFTAVSEERFRAIAGVLVEDGFAPEWFASIDYVEWSGRYKDILPVATRYNRPVVLVDDLSDYIHPNQRQHWIPIPVFDPQRPDEELSAILKELCRRVSSAD